LQFLLQFLGKLVRIKTMDANASYSSEKIRAWLGHSPKYIPTAKPEIKLWSLQEGDVLVACTKNTRYEFRWFNNGSASLTTSRDEGREARRVRLLGCTMDNADGFRAGVVFCGGNLDFVSDEGRVSHHTTPVQTLEVVKRS
jgi:hypothetical protein